MTKRNKEAIGPKKKVTASTVECRNPIELKELVNQCLYLHRFDPTSPWIQLETAISNLRIDPKIGKHLLCSHGIMNNDGEFSVELRLYGFFRTIRFIDYEPYSGYSKGKQQILISAIGEKLLAEIFTRIL